MAKGKSIKDIDKWFGSGLEGPAPASFFGGTHAYEPGESVKLSLTLDPGDYSFLVAFEEGKKRKEVHAEFTVS